MITTLNQNNSCFYTSFGRLFSATMDNEGIVYDAFEFKRFVDPERTVYADGQSIWEEGKPWHRILELGTNMFQKITGPDGNPLGNFNGKV